MGENRKDVRLQHINPQFLVVDIQAAIEYYEKKLGFHVEFSLGEPPVFAAVIRTGIVIYLKQIGQPEPSRQFKADGNHYDAFIFTNDAEALYQEYVESGANILEPLADTDYGMKEFLVADPDGYLIRFGR
jgi:uncharacterized glyoxalase superfamily protein PhnB